MFAGTLLHVAGRLLCAVHAVFAAERLRLLAHYKGVAARRSTMLNRLPFPIPFQAHHNHSPILPPPPSPPPPHPHPPTPHPTHAPLAHPHPATILCCPCQRPGQVQSSGFAATELLRTPRCLRMFTRSAVVFLPDRFIPRRNGYPASS